MNRWKFALLWLAVCSAATPMSAAVISRDWKTPGDGLLTYDDVNQREWLDLTQSRLAMFPGTNFDQRYQNAQVEFAQGGLFDGFIVAKTAELSALTLSAGIQPGQPFAVNDAPMRILIDLVGPSIISPIDPDDRVSSGLLDEIGGPPQFSTNGRLYGQLFRDQPGNAGGFAALLIKSNPDAGDLVSPANTGIWMYRMVPEPASWVVALLGFLGVHGRPSSRLASNTRRLPRAKRSHLRSSRIEPLETRQLLTAADVVFVIDESFSSFSDPTHEWVSIMASLLEDEPLLGLASKGIDDVRYGLVGFAGPGDPLVGQQSTNHGYSIVLNSTATTAPDKLIGTHEQLIDAFDVPVLRQTGDPEDGWDAIEQGRKGDMLL